MHDKGETAAREEWENRGQHADTVTIHEPRCVVWVIMAILVRIGIAVERVEARNTSKRCSRCGRTGHRKGKTFTCAGETCGLVLDADLNAARNVTVASISPRLHAKGAGARYHPVAGPAPFHAAGSGGEKGFRSSPS